MNIKDLPSPEVGELYKFIGKEGDWVIGKVIYKYYVGNFDGITGMNLQVIPSCLKPKLKAFPKTGKGYIPYYEYFRCKKDFVTMQINDEKHDYWKWEKIDKNAENIYKLIGETWEDFKETYMTWL